MTERTCEQADCARTVKCRGLCDMHYHRWQRHGSPDANHNPRMTPAEALERVVAFRLPRDGCWLVKSERLSSEGYGVTYLGDQTVGAHRLSYELYVGPIPAGLQIDHLCRVRHCVNPDHLEPVTSQANSLRSPFTRASINKGRTHCPAGHGYTPENTYLYRGGRICKACRRDRQRAYSARGRQLVAA